MKRVEGRSTLLASASDDRTIRIWEVPSGRALCVLKAHTKGIEAIRFDSLTGLLFSASNDGSMCMWDTDRIYEVAVVRGEVVSAEDKGPLIFPHVEKKMGVAQEVNTITAHPSGNVVATGDGVGVVRVWYTAREFPAHIKKQCQVALVAATPLVNGGYRSGADRLIHILSTEFSQISNILWSNSGFCLMATSAVDGRACVWEWCEPKAKSEMCIPNSFLFSVPTVKFSISTLDVLNENFLSGGSHQTKDCKHVESSDFEPKSKKRGRKPKSQGIMVIGKTPTHRNDGKKIPSLDACTWSCDDRWIVTSQCVAPSQSQSKNLRAFWDQQIRVWSSHDGKLLRLLFVSTLHTFLGASQ